ncbi:protein TASOR isoform X2 [Parambassis ranga]|uniref:Protein TASOR isoform X2 n=1 Tax=Parambassis ranga TaxID=210632 RepID=A0A6P7K7H6_9TELE|nr:protein TASOR-like isoform X2 [Parambassis ranga]
MDDILARREPGRPRRVSAAPEIGANISLQDVEVFDVYSGKESYSGADRLSAAAGRKERWNSAPQMVHHRHMPMEPLKLPIPRKAKENRALFQEVSTESREFEDMMTALTSSYLDTSSAGCFSYCRPRLVHNELLEKEFVEKRKEMKTEGRMEKELEESYCFLLTDSVRVTQLCQKGLCVGPSWLTVLGDPNKGVYLSRYSDLLQINPFAPGTTGEIIIFKVMKGKVKSIYENMKNVLDPTPRFDSHISKNSSKVTSLSSYRAFELTQQYFYEYSFDELRERPRQVCPFAAVSFQCKGKDAPLPNKPLAPIRLNSQPDEGSKERAQFTVWTGDLVKNGRVLFQIALRSFSPPFLPFKLQEKLEIGYVMKLDQLTGLLPSGLLSYNLYDSSQEVVKDGRYCSLLEVIDRNRSTTSVTQLLLELEMKRLVLVTKLSERGFLFLLSSVQMATPAERGESWRRCLQALFVFPESRDVATFTAAASSSKDASAESSAGASVMPRLNQFIPALHHALVKARANPAPDLSAGVERQTRDYLSGLNDGKVRQYPMGKYNSNPDERGQVFPPPKHHRMNMDNYLRSYLFNPNIYLLSVARARQVVEAHCSAEQPQELWPRNSSGTQRESALKEAKGNSRGVQTNAQKMQQLIDLVVTCKRNAENEVRKEEEEEGLMGPGLKRKREQETAEKALKFLKVSQEPASHHRIPAEESHGPSSPVSLASVISSVGLKEVDLTEDRSELAARLLSLLTGLDQAARGITNRSVCEEQLEEQRESCPFERLATKLGLPANCDIDLRKQEELEDQMAGSISSLEGFSPSSHSGETNHHGRGGGGGGGGGRGLGRGAGGYEEEEVEGEIPWVLIPITGLCSERYTQRDRNIPQDPRFQHFAMATSVTVTPKPPEKSPALSPEFSPPPSHSQCPSPDPSPPPSPSQCPSPDSSPPVSPSQCPSPEPSPPSSPSRCPSPQPTPSQLPFSETNPPPSSSWCRSLEPNKLSHLNMNQNGANEEQLAPPGVSVDKEEKPQGKEKNKEPYFSASIRPSNPPAPNQRTKPSPPNTERVKEKAEGDTAKVRQAQAQSLEEQKETCSAEKHKAGGGERAEEQVTAQEGNVSSPPAGPPRGIDSIVDKHLGDMSSEIQLLLREESVHCSFSHSPLSASHTETTAPQRFPYGSVSQFSQYVSFFNPCPPVEDYVCSLKDGINGMLTEFSHNLLSHTSVTSQTTTDATLANSVSAFLASIRASNTKTDGDDEVSPQCGDLTAADVGALLGQSSALSSLLKSSPVTLSVPTSASAASCPLKQPSQSQWTPQQGHSVEISRTVTQNTRQNEVHSTVRTVLCKAGAEGGNSLAGDVSLPGFSGGSKSWAEPSHPSEPDSSSASIPTGPLTHPAPPATTLSSVISQLQPEVFDNLVEIIKDMKKNSMQFYIHCTEPRAQFYEDIKEYLLKQGNVEQSPVDFLNQDSSDSKLLVIIKNKDIAEHVHKIPDLVSLKRLSSVGFVGIDTLDDIRNNSYNELFVSGGCIVSDELVLSPDVVSHDRLAALLMLLEQRSSSETVWRWKIHCRTHKKLKEQARWRADAASILDLLSAYQKRQIIEFLPYHRCDMNPQSPDLNCLIELQARYTQYRHTILLTEQRFERIDAHSRVGIIVASMEEILHNFPRLVGCHDIKDKQPVTDDVLAPKGVSRPLSRGDSVSSSERSPSIFPDHTSSLSFSIKSQHLFLPSGSGLPSRPHPSDQLVPDASCREGVLQPTDMDCEVLRQAISQLRAERQAERQRLESQSINPFKRFLPNPAGTGSGRSTPPSGQGGATDSVQLTPGRKAVSATLELIHSTLQPEEQERREARGTAEGWRRAGGAGGAGGGVEPGDHRDGTVFGAVALQGGDRDYRNGDTLTLSSNHNAVRGPSDHIENPADQQGEPAPPTAAQRGGASRGTTVWATEGDRSSYRH